MVGAVSPISYGVAPAAFQRINGATKVASDPAAPAAPAETGDAGKVATPTTSKTPTTTNALGLTPEQQAQVEELKQRDQEVRRHEAAHAGAGGPYAGSPSFTYTTGPDGKRYATGGEVAIDVAPIPGDPAATVQKLRRVIAAALAPADPSGQDRAVAAQAQAALAQAEAELASSKGTDQGGGDQGQGATDEKARFAQAANAYRDAAGTGASSGRADQVPSLLGLVA